MIIHGAQLVQWTETLGYVGLVLILFVETGLFFGFVLPGDSLVFAAGLLAAKGYFNIWLLLLFLIPTAFIGYLLGYWFGDKLGHWLLKKPDSLFFKKKYLEQSRVFYAKHGGKALVLGRVIPVVRTFVPIVAGMASMPYSAFLIFNALGALFWAGCFTLAGYYLGTAIPNIIDFILPIVFGIILLSILPGIWSLLRKRFKSNRSPKP